MKTQALMDHIVLLVADIAVSAAWYDAFTGLLGFERIRQHVYLHPGGWSIDLRQASDSAEPYGRYNIGLNHISLRVEDAATVLAVRAAFAEKGFDAPAPQKFKGKVAAVFFIDPDGMRWEVGHDEEAE